MKSFATSVAALGTVLLLAVVPAHGSGAGAPDGSAAGADTSAAAKQAPKGEKKYRTSAQRAVNAHRAEADLKKVRFTGQRCLRKAAAAYAERSADAQGMVPHDLKALARRCEVSGLREALGIGFTTGAKMVDAWMTVGGSHRRAVMHRKNRVGAVEARRGDDGLWYGIMLVAAS
ncbi:hypothetical protein IEQ44_03875 [Nocardioides sp. Y6]|uniref:SCP domain-containing protein n=1 Tax=Nocardioides malaquae TaxID=2773426 RepID=A0ABR9RQD6_9ACTN|nr:hypothetical protein [Nocardioides malaquae]MBE7323786.1 hypothetical protein [Nocardioides malaquae]